MSPLEPKIIAVIGASTDEKKLGHAIFKNLITEGYKGKVIPIHPEAESILSKKAYPSVLDIPEAIDMAVVVTPAKTVCSIARECGKKKIKTLVVISAGFSEIHTDEGETREKELVDICDEHGMTLIGPNCLGVLRPSKQMNASFAVDVPEKGPIALLSQSGALMVAVMDESKKHGLGYSMIISMGNKAQTDVADFLEWCEKDKETKVIGIYLEDVKDGEKFRQVASRITKTKPIVMIKSGVSLRGKQAVSSHTGALAGMDAAIDAVCAQTGIHRAHSYEEFLDLLKVLSMQPALLSKKIAVITNAGGPGILATDAAEREGLILTDLMEKTLKALQKSLPEAASNKNPVDVLGDAGADRYEAALAACAADENVDGIAVLLTPQVMTPAQDIAHTILKTQKKYPLVPIVTSFMGDDHVREAIATLHKNNVPNFASPEGALHAFAALVPVGDHTWTPREKEESLDDRASSAKEVVSGMEGYVDELVVQDLLALYGVSVPRQSIAKTREEAVQMAQDIGLPVVLKVSSPDLPHKTDVGGVKANLKTKKDVEKAYDEIIQNIAKHAPSAGVTGILVQQFLPVGHEMIVGAIRDDTFGPLIMAGMGGIYTELMRDTAFRLAPLTEKDAYAMLTELKGWKVLTGLRGAEQLDIPALQSLIVILADLMLDTPEIAEIDFNPVFIGTDGYVIADAKVRVSPADKTFLHPDTLA